MNDLNLPKDTKSIKEKISEDIKARKEEQERLIAESRAKFYGSLAALGFFSEERRSKGEKFVADFYDRHLGLKKESSRGKSFLETPFEKILRNRYQNDVEKQAKLMNFMARVRNDAGLLMIDDEDFARRFIQTNEFEAAILSVDIRRSTELMLRCESAEVYSEFISHLLEGLTDSVKEYYGIYDKFTGDGFLAFFPDFFSGRENLLNAMLCAMDCQRIFDEIFEEYKKFFELKQVTTGLGAGIDYGCVYKAGAEMEYSVIGKPVVYACRFSAAPSGHLYLTKNAFDKFLTLNRNEMKITQTKIEIKHEEAQTAFDVTLNNPGALYEIKTALPDWKEKLEKVNKDEK